MREFFIESEEVRLEAERIFTRPIPNNVKEIIIKADFDTRYAFLAITGYYDDHTKEYIPGLMDRKSECIPFYSVADILAEIYKNINDKIEAMPAEEAEHSGDKLQFLYNIRAACETLIQFLCDTEIGEEE